MSRAALDEIRRIYFATTRGTIERDFARAIELLRSMASEDERERATAYMHGLAEMRAQWARRTRRASGPRSAAPRARSDRSTPGARRRR